MRAARESCRYCQEVKECPPGVCLLVDPKPKRETTVNLQALYAILAETTAEFRKGPEVQHRDVGPLHVTEIHEAPHVDAMPAGLETVDVFFFLVGVRKTEAEKRRDELIELLEAYPEPDRLAAGPSYIEIGGTIGDQGAALRLFGLGQVLGLWKIITPTELGVTGERAREMAGMGYVMITGYRSGTSA